MWVYTVYKDLSEILGLLRQFTYFGMKCDIECMYKTFKFTWYNLEDYTALILKIFDS